ncbi:MAG: Ig-like domain-containing protein [Marinilabiliales bacterium]|nr:Ig-like domain-containing protein [Marinilabiliales bacterium]
MTGSLRNSWCLLRWHTKPDIRLKGKSLLVSWDEELADSTTYTFYFQDAIRDNNENNPIPNYQYVFSTGPVPRLSLADRQCFQRR